MSSSATASVAAVSGTAVGVGVGAIALGGMVVVGGAILIGRGLVWCGQKLEENYQNACQDWTNQVDRARAENMRNVQEMGGYLADQLDCLAVSTALTTTSGGGSQAGMLAEQEQQLQAAFARTQQILADGQRLTQNHAETRQNLVSYRLQTEIAAAQGLLPAQEISRAQAALDKTPAEMQQALIQLQAAWGKVTSKESTLKRAILQTQQILQTVDVQLTAIDALQRNESGSSQPIFIAQQTSVERLAQEAKDLLSADQPVLALDKARAAEQATRQLMEIISSEMVTAWSQRQKELNTLRGMLTSLDNMLQEAQVAQLLNVEQVKDLTARVQKDRAGMDALLENGTPLTPQQFARLKVRVDLLKQEVFALVETTQQRNVAQVVATTLIELGFRAGDGKEQLFKQQGKTIHIQAVARAEDEALRNEKIVSFDIAPDGAIFYDFSGYVGDSCIAEGQRIFAALRQKGIFILDDRGSAALQRLSDESITVETLQEERFAPTVVRNKTQAELAESLLRILQKMGYPVVQERTIGGSIELEAFKGEVGYRVVLSPDGEARILKDAQHTDVSVNALDPLAAEVQRINQKAQETEEQEDQEEKLPRRSTTFQQKKQQAQG